MHADELTFEMMLSETAIWALHWRQQKTDSPARYTRKVRPMVVEMSAADRGLSGHGPWVVLDSSVIVYAQATSSTAGCCAEDI
jgi:hypothetical protein